MVARMEEQGHDVLLLREHRRRPRRGADNKQAAHMHALAYNFLWNQLK